MPVNPSLPNGESPQLSRAHEFEAQACVPGLSSEPGPLISANASSPPGGEEALPLYKGETENAYAAFYTFLGLGPTRDHQKTAEATSTSIHTIRFWSARFRWKERIQLLNARKLQGLLEAQAAQQAEAAVDWAKRCREQNELQWDSGNELLAATRECLREFRSCPENMSLGQIANAMETSSKVCYLAVQRATAKPDASANDISALRRELEASLKKAHPCKEAAKSTPPAPAESANSPAE
jgi:hypothetical protein